MIRQLPAFRLIGDPVKVKGRNSYCQRFRIAGQKVRKVGLGTSDKRTALRRAEEYVEKRVVELTIESNPSLKADYPLKTLLGDYERFLTTESSSADHQGIVISRCTRIIAECGFDTIYDVTELKIREWIAKQQRKRKKPMGAQTASHYKVQFKSFLNFLSNHYKISNPVADMKTKPRGDIATTFVRRALDDQEFAILVGNAEQSERTRYCLDGQQRALLYKAARYTGFRASELAALTPASCRLDDNPEIQIVCTVSKRRRYDRAFLTPDLTVALRDHIAEYEVGRNDPIWPRGCWSERSNEVMKTDLEGEAGIVVEDSEEGRASFHSLRHSFVSEVASRTSVANALTICRLSSPSLLMGRYFHPDEDRLRAVIEGRSGASG